MFRAATVSVLTVLYKANIRALVLLMPSYFRLSS